jgi:hypothetical protein
MGDTTALLGAVPESQTQWHDLAAKAHRDRGRAGDEAAAKTHELLAWEIREGLSPGNSTKMRFCPCCLERGVKYILLWGGPGPDWCGACLWPRSL